MEIKTDIKNFVSEIGAVKRVKIKIFLLSDLRILLTDKTSWQSPKNEDLQW